MRLLKSLALVAALAALAFTGPANSADAYRYPTKAAPNNVFDWSGFYVGGSVGYAFGDIDYSGLGASVTVEPRGVTVGGLVGYNFHFARNWIFGLEADLDWTNIDRTNSVGLSGGYDYLASARARLGYSFGTWMVYGTGGWAGGHIASSVAGFTADDFATGYVFGAGIEAALWRGWSADLSWRRYVLDGPQNFGPGTLNTDTDLDIVKLALKYRFGGL